MAERIEFPYEIVDVDAEQMAEIKKHFFSPITGYVQVGLDKYFYYNGYKRKGPKIYNMEIRPTDTFVITFPKSGTTWTQELVWLLGNNLDYEAARATILDERFPFLDLCVLFEDKIVMDDLKKIHAGDQNLLQFLNHKERPILEMLDNMPSSSRRFIKSHLPLALLPPTLLDTAKVVYVARDPRDIAVSYFHHMESYKLSDLNCDFKTYWRFFVTNMVAWAPYFPHVKEAWSKRKHPNMIFLFYEELIKDLPGCTRRVADFMGKPLTSAQVARLTDHLSFDNFKKNPSVNLDWLKQLGVFSEKASFIRKGKTGGWRDYFDEEMAAQAQRWIDDNLRGTDLRFPTPTDKDK